MYPGKIYLAQCLLGKRKIYVGQTFRSLQARIDNHKKASTILQDHFHRALNKYGFENFKWELLAEDIPIEELDDWEMYYIWLYQSYTYGYNLTTGGNSKGKELSEIVRQKMSDSRKKYIREHPELRDLLRKKFLGKTRSEKIKIKISEKLKNRKFSEEFFIKKRNKRYITNGKESRQVNLGEELPEGWFFGRTFLYHAPLTRSNFKKVQCVETGKIFASVAEARRCTGANNIRYAIRENKTSNGYHWQEVINTNKEV